MNFIKNPSRKNLILFTSLWLFEIILFILSVTNLFTESFFQKEYLVIYLLIISSTILIINIYTNYRKNENSQSTTK